MVDDSNNISTRYGEVTGALNRKFRSLDSKTKNSLRVGSYGRWSAIKGISDLDMIYILPKSCWDLYEKKHSLLLKDTKDAIVKRYPRTEVKVDRLVVQVKYQNFYIEVQPVFEQEDGSFLYPDTYYGGSWKTTRPCEELKEMFKTNDETNRNFRRLCKMIRAWKNKHGIVIGGLLIDSIAYKFFKSNYSYNDKSYNYYDFMVKDFFCFMKDLPKNDYFLALGSNQRVKVKKNFQKKAKEAYELCQKAISADGQNNRNDKWRNVFGRSFPPVPLKSISDSANSVVSTEQFIDENFSIDIRYLLQIDCEITQDGFRSAFLKNYLMKKLPLSKNRKLKFFIEKNEVPQPYKIYWKVLNRGVIASEKNCIRGQIFEGQNFQIERSDFNGDHIVECYIVVNNVVVARDIIDVPIKN